MSALDAFEYFAQLSLTNLVTTDELLLLMSVYTTDQLSQEKTHETFKCFDIDNFSIAQCKGLFQFEKDDLIDLAQMLALPNEYVGHNGIVWSPLEGTCMLLHRLCYPGRLVDLQLYFG